MKNYGPDAYISNDKLCKLLKEIAYNEAEEGEYHPEEHTCWIAAKRLEDMQNLLDGKSNLDILTEVINRLKQEEILKIAMNGE